MHPPSREVSRDEYTVACVCPMGVELAAVEGMLDEFHESCSLGRDSNSYTLGRIGVHNVVVAVMPSTGNNQATAVSIQLLNDFPSIRFGLLVGIGGGIPGEEEDDIRLGDVVISKPTSTFGGVVQYDMGKMADGGKFYRTGSLSKPPPMLSANVQRLQAQHRRVGSQISKYVFEMTQKFPAMEKEYVYPGKEHDELFASTYAHHGGRTCRDCDRNKLVGRKSRTDLQPQIHYGTIGSANMVIKDGITRDRLKEELGVLCVEMEAAGLMDEFRCLVIRGICDYADSHKNKAWQPYAAAVAAAYAKELLYIIPRHQVLELVPDSETSSGPNQRGQDARLLFNDLRCMDFPSALDAIQVPHPRTCDWLFQNKAFVLWARTQSPIILWIRGPPGYGKTILLKNLVTNSSSHPALKTELKFLEESTMVHYFFRTTDPKGRSEVAFLKSILGQFLTVCPALSSVIRYELEKGTLFTTRDNATNTVPSSAKELWAALIGALYTDMMCSVLLIVDGLDEATNMDLDSILNGLMTMVDTLRKEKPLHQVKLVISSRRLPQIRRRLNGPYVTNIDLDQASFGSDLQLYVRESVADFGAENGFPDQLISSIANKIIGGAEGMFLWARLAWDTFKQGVVLWNRNTIDQQLKLLTSLPFGLEALFEKLILSIEPRALSELKLLLSVLAVAGRPLKCDELSHLLAVEHWQTRSGQLDPAFSVQKLIEQHCPTLFVVNDRQQCIFLHISLREYLASDLLKQEVSDAHHRIATSCLHFFGFEDFNQVALVDFKKDRGSECLMFERFVLYPYATSYFRHHLEMVSFDDELWMVYSRLVRKREVFYISTDSTHFNHCQKATENCWSKPQTPLRHVLKLGAIDLAKKFVANGYDVDEQVYLGPFVPTPLHLWINDPAMVTLLLEMGASPNCADLQGRTALHLSQEIRSHSLLIKLLSVAGVNLNAQDVQGRTLLHYDMLPESRAALLSDPRTDLTKVDNRGRTAMTWAAYWGDLATFTEIFQSPGLVIAHQKESISPLICAAQHQWKELTKALIHRISNIDEHRGTDRKGIVHWCVINGWYDILCLAVETAKASINMTDRSGKTALHCAAQLGQFHAVRQLVRYGASARIQDRSGFTAVHIAANEGFADTLLPLLLDSDFDVNDEDVQSRTMIHWAASCDWLLILAIVIENPEVNFRKKDIYGRTAVHIAALCGCPGALKMLLETSEYDLEQKDAFGNTLLHLAARGRSLSVMEILLSQPDINKTSVNKWGQTALDVSAIYGATEATELLRQIGLQFRAARDPLLESPTSSKSEDVKMEFSRGPLVPKNYVFDSRISRPKKRTRDYSDRVVLG